MKLRLKEDPKEWRTFALVWGCLLGVLAVIAAVRDWISQSVAAAILVAAAVFLLIALVRPAAVRPIYRAVMTGAFHIGQVMGRIILTAFYFLVLTPMALALRIAGKNLLDAKWSGSRRSCWKQSQNRSISDRQF